MKGRNPDSKMTDPVVNSADTDPGKVSAVSKKQLRRWRKYLAEERLEADTYRYLARRRSGDEREVLQELSIAEERHEQYWLNLLGEDALPTPRASLRSRLLNFFTRIFGTIFMLAMMQRAEQRHDYEADLDVPKEMVADEKIHSEVVRGLAARQRATISGSFRAAVFGVNDGLVSTCALILGIFGTGVSKTTIIATGLAGLLSGALSMGAGEYVSVRSQTELLASSSPDPESEHAIDKLNMNENELALVFRARGDDAETADRKASAAFSKIKKGGHAHLEANSQEYEEIGTGMKAAISSFTFFAIGAFIPLFPFLLPLSPLQGAIVAVILVGLALIIVGGIVGLLSGVDPAPKALRQLMIGYGAAGATYLLGLGIGTRL